MNEAESISIATSEKDAPSFIYSKQDYRKGAPLYRIVRDDMELEYGCYYAKPSYKWHDNKFYDSNPLHKPVLVTTPLDMEYEAHPADLTRNTFYKDIEGDDIFEGDFVHIVSSSLMDLVTGFVKFNPTAMAYEVIILREGIAEKWPMSVPITEYSWKIIYDTSKRWELEDKIHRYPHLCPSYSYRFCLSNSQAAYNYNVQITGRKMQKVIRQEVMQYKALVNTSEGSKQITGYPVALKDDPGKYFIYPANIKHVTAEEFIHAARKYGFYGDKVIQYIKDKWPVNEASKINTNYPWYDRWDLQFDTSDILPIIPGTLRKCIFATSISRQYRYHNSPIYEGDKLVLKENPNIYGYLVYRPELAKYAVEVPENVMPRDSLFDGYYHLSKEADPVSLDASPYSNEVEEYLPWELIWKLPDSESKEEA